MILPAESGSCAGESDPLPPVAFSLYSQAPFTIFGLKLESFPHREGADG